MSDDRVYPWTNNRDVEFYTGVGLLCHHWNIVERFYFHLASDIMRLPRSKHDVLFRHLGIVAISSFLREYAQDNIKVAATHEQIEHVIKFVDKCRKNRNTIVHGFATIDGNFDVIKIRTAADKYRPKTREFAVSLHDIGRACNDCEMAAWLCIALQFLFFKKGVKLAKSLLGADWRARLHVKPPLPRLLAVNPQSQKGTARAPN